MMPMNSRFNITAFLAGLLLFTTFSILSLQEYQHSSHSRYAASQQPLVQSQRAKIAKVSVVYGEANEWYTGAVATHEAHARVHGYPVHILRNPVGQGYWNKALYLQSILVQELGKPADERVEWLMWFDADSLIINPEIPVEIFLPPDDFKDVHFLANKDQNGLNTGIFFVRVHEWSIKMFTRTLGWPLFKPDVDLGYSADQTAMALIFNESDYQPHVMYQPRQWYNTYQFHHGYEGTPGHLLVHFPGLEDDRWKQMGAWLHNLDDATEAMRWKIPVQETQYPQETERFWRGIRKSRALIDVAKKQLNENAGDLALAAAIESLEYSMKFETDSMSSMERAIEQVRIAVDA